VIDENSGVVVVLFREEAAELGNDTGCRRLELVNGDAVAWGGDGRKATSCRFAFGSPWSARGLADSATVAKRRSDSTQNWGQKAFVSHFEHTAMTEMIEAVVPMLVEL